MESVTRVFESRNQETTPDTDNQTTKETPVSTDKDNDSESLSSMQFNDTEALLSENEISQEQFSSDYDRLTEELNQHSTSDRSDETVPDLNMDES